MGYYYTNTPAEDPDKPPGCLDTLIVIRIVMGFLLIPLGAILGVFGLFSLAFWLFTIHPALALLPVIAGVGALLLVERWYDKRRSPPS